VNKINSFFASGAPAHISIPLSFRQASSASNSCNDLGVYQNQRSSDWYNNLMQLLTSPKIVSFVAINFNYKGCRHLHAALQSELHSALLSAGT
jgi:hypothetical protein